MKNKDLVGTKINGLKIVAYLTKDKRQYFELHCVCGFYFQCRTDAIKSGRTKSCGCISGDLISLNNKLPDNKAAINLVIRHYKQGAKKRGLKFSLSIPEFESFIFGNCYYCKAPPSLSRFTSSQKNRRDKELIYNGIDRIDSNIGYTIKNCVSCCCICNRAKSDLSLAEFKEWIARLKDFNE